MLIFVDVIGPIGRLRNIFEDDPSGLYEDDEPSGLYEDDLFGPGRIPYAAFAILPQFTPCFLGVMFVIERKSSINGLNLDANSSLCVFYIFYTLMCG